MGEYEPNDSRNVTGAANQQGQNEGTSNENVNQTGEHWRQQDASISQSPQQGHGQDGPQAGQQPSGQQQQQQFQSGASGQQGGSGETGVAGQIREHMEVIGADGTHVGTVDAVEGDRIKLTKKDSGAGYEGGEHTGHHHYLSLGLVAGVEGDTVRLSANGDVAYGLEEEEGGTETE